MWVLGSGENGVKKVWEHGVKRAREQEAKKVIQGAGSRLVFESPDHAFWDSGVKSGPRTI